MRDAPHVWADTAKLQTAGMGVQASKLHPSAHWHEKRRNTAAVHADDLLCIVVMESLTWLSGVVQTLSDLKRHMLEPDRAREVT